MQRFRIPALICLMVVAGIVGAAIYDWGKPVVSQVQERVTEAVLGKKAYDRFTDPEFRERFYAERERRQAQEQRRRELADLERRMSDRIECLERRAYGCY